MAGKKGKKLELSNDKFELTSMIDVVFLLLIYFMYLPMGQEADLKMQLPVDLPPTDVKTILPNEQSIDINPDGSIMLNGAPIDAPGRTEFVELANTLRRLRESADRSQTPTVVTIFADADSPHQASISVLDACAIAKVTSVSFSKAQ